MTMPLDASSLGETAAGTRAGGAAQGTEAPVDARAWQREMERAQTQDWFQGAVQYRQQGIGTQGAAGQLAKGVGGTVASVGPAVKALSGSVQQVAIQAIRLDLGVEDSTAASPDTRSAPAHVRSGVPGIVNAVQPATKDVAEVARAAGVASIGSVGLQQQEDGEDMPVRLHVEVSESGARLWIGMTAPSDAQIEQAVAEVRRRLAERGIALAGVTCNGKPWQNNLSAHADTARPAPYPKEGVIHGIDR